jgi:hypothetical protein
MKLLTDLSIAVICVVASAVEIVEAEPYRRHSIVPAGERAATHEKRT